ncbi:MAG TPA: ABC transporter permease subunit [Ruminiclostridium sp.]|nr:ABC transporter permease subunit [Ruminiclostridium sp.]
MLAIYKREIKSYFTSAIGYIFITVFVFFASWFFVSYNLAYDSSDLSSVFASMLLIYVFIIPILTMRTFSDEKRQKTDQALLTAPVNLTGIVMGKFLAALTIYAIGLFSYVIFALIVGASATLDTWSVVGNIVAMLLVGAAFISIGIFISNLTESQVISAVAGIIVLLVLFLLDTFANVSSVPFINNIISAISINNRYSKFAAGIFNLSDAVFYLSIAVSFVFLTVRLLEKRRWS